VNDINALNFAYWLQGYFELTDSGQQMSAQQVQIIKDHLDLVFTKVTPNYLPIASIAPYPFAGDKIQDGWPNGQYVFDSTPQVTC